MSEGGEEFRRNKGHQLRDEGTNRGNGNGSSNRPLRRRRHRGDTG